MSRWDAFADYDWMPVEAAKFDTGDSRSVEDLVYDSTVKQIEFLVESGELTAEEVFEAESKGKQRKAVLAEYGPESKPAEG